MDNTMNRETVVGVFRDRAAAERAVRDLEAAGFSHGQIGVVAPHEGEPGVDVSTAPEYETHAGSGAAAGAVVGGVLGAAAALLIPGIGPVVAGGILAAALGGAAVGVVAGGIVGALVGMGVPEEEAHYYEGEFKAGRTLVTVRARERYDEARDILRRDGAYDVHEPEPMEGLSAEHLPPAVGDLAPAAPQFQVPPPQPAPSAASAPEQQTMAGQRMTPGQERRIPVVEEELVARTRPEQVGEVDIEKNVVSEQRTIEVPVSHDEVVVERVPENRSVRPGEHPFQEQTLRVPVTEEEVSAEKRAHVVGEVVVEKEQVTQSQTVSGTVRREEVQVQRNDFTGNASGEGMTSSVATRPWNEMRPTYQNAFQQRFGNRGRRWEEVEPAYEFGHNARSNPRYRGRRFNEVEPDLRRDWEARGGGSPWEVVREYIVVVWEEPTSRAA